MGCTTPGGGAQFWGFPVPTASTTSMQLHFDGEGVGTCLFFLVPPCHLFPMEGPPPDCQYTDEAGACDCGK